VTPEQYWARIRRVPLTPERETSDGDAIICRMYDGTPVRVTKPEYFLSDDRQTADEKREAALAWYESQYSPPLRN
jgi:hypothetical protein